MRPAKDPERGGFTLSGSPRVEGSALSEALRRAVADLVLETTVEGIWLIDADARTTFVNHRLAELLGYSEDEMIGRPVFDFLDRQRWPIAERNLQQRALGIEDRQEVQLVRKDGQIVWVLGSANPVFDAEGNYAGALALLGDLSPQKEREQALRARIAGLQARLAAASGGRAQPAATESPAYREPFRTAIALGALAALTATIGIVTIGAVAGSLCGPSEGRDAPD
jgi:PAS domain S-box-containing protein